MEVITYESVAGPVVLHATAYGAIGIYIGVVLEREPIRLREDLQLYRPTSVAHVADIGV